MATLARGVSWTPPGCAIEVREGSDGRIVARLDGDLDMAGANRVLEALSEAVERAELVVVDLHDLSFIDSTGISALYWAHRAAEQSGGRLVLNRPSPAVLRVVELLGLTELELSADVGLLDGAAPSPARHEGRSPDRSPGRG